MTNALIDLFAEVLEVDANLLSEDSSPDTVEEWDSLGAMHLVAAMEQQFGIEISTKEIMRMNTLRLTRETLRGKGADV